jgi:hypothetical protein
VPLRQALELEEFQALERQILKDVPVDGAARGRLHPNTVPTTVGAGGSCIAMQHPHPSPCPGVQGGRSTEAELPAASFLAISSAQAQPSPARQSSREAAAGGTWLSALGISESDDNASIPSRPTSAAAPSHHSAPQAVVQQRNSSTQPLQPAAGAPGRSVYEDSYVEFDDRSTWTDLDYCFDSASQANGHAAQDAGREPAGRLPGAPPAACTVGLAP